MAAIDQEYEVTALLTEDCQYLRINSWMAFRRALSKWVGKDLIITVKVLRYKRSASQNRYYWYAIQFIRHWFFDTQGLLLTKDEVHIWVHRHLLEEKPKVVSIAGEQVITMTHKSTSAMTTTEFAEMVDTILTKMAEMGCVIPEPRKEKKSLQLLEEFISDD